MSTISRNAPCPCGSGKKFKKCCGKIQNGIRHNNHTNLNSDTLKPAIRMKGGVTFDPESDGYIAIVHSWNNAECGGTPQEWRDPDIFQTEDEAMNHYKKDIRPKIEELMNKLLSKNLLASVSQNKIEL